MIASSLLDDAWLRQLTVTDSIFFVAAGVLYYLQESDIKVFLKKLATAFPGSEILFDAFSPLGLKIANKKVIKAGGMDESALLTWSLHRAQEMESWDNRIAVVAEYPIFRKMKRGHSIRDRWGMLMSDFLRIMSVVHLRLGHRPVEDLMPGLEKTL